MISASTVHILAADTVYPQANGYGEITETLPSIGGEAINSAVTLSRLGASVKFDGNWLNPKHEKKIRELLSPYGMDLSRLTFKEGHGTEEFVIADKNTRTCFGNYQAFHTGPPQWNPPREEDIKNARYAVLDPYFREESRLAAEMCVRNNKPYVTLDCPYDDFVAGNAGAVVISHEILNSDYAGRDDEKLFDCYRKNCGGLVIFTYGEKEFWYARNGEEKQIYKPYPIDPVDTTGAGDAFRGALAFALYKGCGWDDRKTVDFAAAVAANVCLKYQHALNAPDMETVLKFIEEKNSVRE